VSIENDIAFFERVPTLRLLGREALRVLAIGAESRYIDDGEVLFHAGDPADGGYIIQEGSFRLKPNIPADAEEITAEPGMLLGELALLSETMRPATAIAREPSAVIRISRSLFLKMLENYPDAASKLRDQIVVRASQAVNDFASVRARLDTSEAPALEPGVRQ
jgi:CRP-like cAMP-binding protein